MRVAERDGEIVTAEQIAESIVRAKGYRAQFGLCIEGMGVIEFDWMGKEPLFKVDHVVLDGFGPSVLILAERTIGLELLDSWHVHDEVFQETRGPAITIVDVTEGGRTEYRVPLGKARF